jgi:hypothetical protein
LALIASGLPVYFLFIKNPWVPKFLYRAEQIVTHFVQKALFALPEDLSEEPRTPETEMEKQNEDNRGKANPAFVKEE